MRQLLSPTVSAAAEPGAAQVPAVIVPGELAAALGWRLAGPAPPLPVLWPQARGRCRPTPARARAGTCRDQLTHGRPRADQLTALRVQRGRVGRPALNSGEAIADKRVPGSGGDARGQALELLPQPRSSAGAAPNRTSRLTGTDPERPAAAALGGPHGRHPWRHHRRTGPLALPCARRGFAGPAGTTGTPELGWWRRVGLQPLTAWLSAAAPLLASDPGRGPGLRPGAQAFIGLRRLGEPDLGAREVRPLALTEIIEADLLATLEAACHFLSVPSEKAAKGTAGRCGRPQAWSRTSRVSANPPLG